MKITVNFCTQDSYMMKTIALLFRVFISWHCNQFMEEKKNICSKTKDAANYIQL
jgi:hypothetical protein